MHDSNSSRGRRRFDGGLKPVMYLDCYRVQEPDKTGNLCCFTAQLGGDRRFEVRVPNCSAPVAARALFQALAFYQARGKSVACIRTDLSPPSVSATFRSVCRTLGIEVAHTTSDWTRSARRFGKGSSSSVSLR